MSFIGDLFGGGKAAPMPPPPAPITPPTIEDTFMRAAQDSDAMRRRQGRASTILAGNSAAPSDVKTATNTLLGS